MTRDDIIRMAREAGFSAYHLAVLDQGIYRFANLVAAAGREWQRLTDEEVRDFWSWSMTQDAEHTANTQQHAFARAIEAKLKERNHG